MKWFKFYGQDYLTDSKLGSLNPFQRLMWVTLLCVASQDDEKTGILKFVRESRIMALSGLYYEDMESMYGTREGDTFATFERIGLISFPDEETLVIVNYSRKQTENMTVAERVAAHRDRKKALSKPYVTESNEPMLQSNKSVTTEERRVEESREEKKREKSVPDKPELHISYLKNLPEEDLKDFTYRFDASPKQIQSKAEDLSNYCEAKGKKYKNYRAFLINALKKDFKEMTEEERERRRILDERIKATTGRDRFAPVTRVETEVDPEAKAKLDAMRGGLAKKMSLPKHV